MIDYRGQIVRRHRYSGGSSWVAGTVDIEALRRFRANAQWDNCVLDGRLGRIGVCAAPDDRGQAEGVA